MAEQVNETIAQISFKGYKVHRLEFRLNDNFYPKEKSKIELDMDFDIDIGIDRQENIAVISLRCLINKEYESMNQPLFLDIIIQSLFSFESGLQDENLYNLLNTNAVAIVFPYLRSVISTVTVNCGVPPVILPTLNIVELVKRKNKEKIS
ncbi:MAG: protein-export chaperone SecB [Desulfosporosinus sp.]|nr:protein-export chaperone SecB [Desulfosporosinus sp.]